MINLGNAYIKLGVSWDRKLLTLTRYDPLIASVKAVLARTTHALHNLGHARVKGEHGRKNHASRFFGSVSEGECMANALAIKKNVGDGVEGDVS